MAQTTVKKTEQYHILFEYDVSKDDHTRKTEEYTFDDYWVARKKYVELENREGWNKFIIMSKREIFEEVIAYKG